MIRKGSYATYIISCALSCFHLARIIFKAVGFDPDQISNRMSFNRPSEDYSSSLFQNPKSSSSGKCMCATRSFMICLATPSDRCYLSKLLPPGDTPCSLLPPHLHLAKKIIPLRETNDTTTMLLLDTLRYLGTVDFSLQPPLNLFFFHVNILSNKSTSTLLFKDPIFMFLSTPILMTSPMNFRLTDLPNELQREIFLHAADADRGQAIRLAQVAHRFHHWLTPTIYEIVTLGSKDTRLFLQTIQCPRTRNYTSYVKKLCLSISVSVRNAKSILSLCSDVTDLAFWVDYLRSAPCRSIIPLIATLPLRRLSIELEHFIFLFSDPSVNHAWCEGLTHLDIRFWTHTSEPVIPYLDHLPSLSYLALRLQHDQASDSSLFNILSTCRMLKVMIIYDNSEGEELIWEVDPRVIYLPHPQNVIPDWESQARGDISCDWFWAEEQIRIHRERQQTTST